MPSGGKIAPDGRPPVAPGVGKTARRHDLEAPATPGLSDPSIQQGDVQRLEQAQQVAPRRKRTQPAAAPQGRQQQRQGVPPGQQTMEVPDPIQMAAGRDTGQGPSAGAGTERLIDPTPWLPFLRSMATRPNSGGAMAATLTDLLRQYRNRPAVPAAYFIDMNEMDEQIARNL